MESASSKPSANAGAMSGATPPSMPADTKLDPRQLARDPTVEEELVAGWTGCATGRAAVAVAGAGSVVAISSWGGALAGTDGEALAARRRLFSSAMAAITAIDCMTSTHAAPATSRRKLVPSGKFPTISLFSGSPSACSSTCKLGIRSLDSLVAKRRALGKRACNALSNEEAFGQPSAARYSSETRTVRSLRGRQVTCNKACSVHDQDARTTGMHPAKSEALATVRPALPAVWAPRFCSLPTDALRGTGR